ncbi:MAG: hypothetical protein NC293_02080 [Roseburia sp.]|nr:hypothetical protein [Roseburia sp.]
MRKKKIKQGLRLAAGGMVFAFLTIGIVLAANYVTKPYDGKADKIEKTLYSEDADMEQAEVALIGGSHALNGFNPSVIWRENRIKTYNFSFSGEPVYMTHYYLKELFKKRSYKLVVFDAYYVGLKNQYFVRDYHVFDVLGKAHWTVDKWNFIRECVAPEMRDKYYLPLLNYHTRWSKIKKADFWRAPNPADDFWLGSGYYFERRGGDPVSFEPWNAFAKPTPMPEYSEKYLRKVIELVQSQGSQLLLVDLPHRYNDKSAPDTWVDDEYSVYERTRQIAAEYGVPFLQFNDSIMAEIGFVPEEDMYNPGHMNVYGSEKVSRYLGNYICENYEVSPVPEQVHDLWDDYLQKYEKAYAENKK